MAKEDWSERKITAEIWMKGGTFAELARANGLPASTLRSAYTRSAPKYEKIIADYLGVPRSEIWPSKYK